MAAGSVSKSRDTHDEGAVERGSESVLSGGAELFERVVLEGPALQYLAAFR